MHTIKYLNIYLIKVSELTAVNGKFFKLFNI